MRLLRFYFKVIRTALTHSIEKAETLSFLLAIVLGALTHFKSGFANVTEIGGWAGPLVFLITIIFFRLLLAPYWICAEEQNARMLLETTFVQVANSLPIVRFIKSRGAQMHRFSPIALKKVPIYELIQAWFDNHPQLPSEASTAKQVSAILKFSLPHKSEILFELHGQWADSTAPDHVGFKGTLSTIDIPPGNIAVKLIVGLKYHDEPDAYAYSLESVTDYPDGRNPSLRLPPGLYRVFVQLTGQGLNRQYSLSLNNPGQGSPLQLSEEILS